MAEYVNYKAPKGPRMYHFGKYSFSSVEIKHLSIALVMLTLTFMFLRVDFVLKWGFLKSFIVFLLIAGSSFLFHELGHKLVAQHFGFISEFRGDFVMLVFGLFMAIFIRFTGFGFVFLAPGAVMIGARYISKKQNGIISVAGPLVNLALSAIFIVIAFITNPQPNSLLFDILSLGIFFNVLIGIFNMIPLWVLDGKKILAWNKPVYFTVLILLLFLFFGGGTALF